MRNACLVRQGTIKKSKMIHSRTPERLLVLPKPIRLDKKIVMEISQIPIGSRQSGVEVPLAYYDLIGTIR